MTEGDRSHAVDLIHKILVITPGCVMAAGTVAGGECLPSVMAVPAIGAVVNVQHCNMSTASFHQEEFWMAFLAAVPPGVSFMVEPRGHGGFVKRYALNVMAISACIFVNGDVLMPLKVMTLVAVNAAANMQPVGE